MRINDKVVSRIADFMPQVDAIEQRLTKSKSWLDSIGKSTNWWETDQKVRQAEVSSDGSIIKNVVPSEVSSITTTSVQLGYPVAGELAYDTATGIITFGGGAPNTDVNFRDGDVIVLTGGVVGAGSLNVKLEIIDVPVGDLTMEVRANIAANIASSDTITFNRIRYSDIPITPASRRIGQFETIYQPPFSLMKIGHALPSMRVELVLNPQTSTAFQKRSIESALGKVSKNPTLAGGVAQNFKMEVESMYFYCCTVEGPRADDITYLLDLEQTRCQSEKIDNTGFAQKNFEVSPSSYALSVAYQDLRAGENTAISSSKFKSYDSANGNLIPSKTDESLKLSRFFINYAGQNLPAPDADPEFKAGVDYTTQRYVETQIYSGSYFDTGGSETIEEWHARGAYYYFSIPRDGTDRSTRVTLHQQFDGADVKNMRVLLFDHSKQVARIKVSEGRVVDVQVEDS
jgi:hypothetical protein